VERARSAATPASYAALIAVTAVWGASFVWVRDAVAVYPIFLFLAVRFTLASLLVGGALLPRLRSFTPRAAVGGFAMGVALFAGYTLQTWGLKYTSAAHSGFITGLFVVFTPLFEAVLLRRLPHLLTAGGVLLATAGLACLSLGGTSGRVNPGDLLSVGCAGVYAVHLLVTSHMSRRHDTATLVFFQLATVSALSWTFAFVGGIGALWPIPPAAARAIVLTALLATALAYWVQTAFQSRVPPTQTALIFTLEPVFAGLFAVWIGGETFGWQSLAGGALIVAGMVAGELGQQRAARGASG